jgi:hypothetical protein
MTGVATSDRAALECQQDTKATTARGGEAEARQSGAEQQWVRCVMLSSATPNHLGPECGGKASSPQDEGGARQTRVTAARTRPRSFYRVPKLQFCRLCSAAQCDTTSEVTACAVVQAAQDQLAALVAQLNDASERTDPFAVAAAALHELYPELTQIRYAPELGTPSTSGDTLQILV